LWTESKKSVERRAKSREHSSIFPFREGRGKGWVRNRDITPTFILPHQGGGKTWTASKKSVEPRTKSRE
jgi:hypothetical protein